MGLEQARANKKALEKMERAKRKKKRKISKGKTPTKSTLENSNQDNYSSSKTVIS